MNQIIPDRDALQALSPIDIRAYLIAQGWTDAGQLNNKAAVYTRRDGEGREWEILLPLRSDLADYAERMAETISIISRVEDRSQPDVYYDLTTAGNDIIRVRAPQADHQGTIGLPDGVVLYEETQNLLLAAACAAVRPRPSYHARKVTEAVEYLDNVRLGQAALGSYVLTVLSPVSPVLRRARPVPGSDFDSDPFSRRVTRKLAEALQATQAALTEAAASDGFAAFETGVQQGINANFCDALARLAQHGHGLEIGMTWAWVRSASVPGARYRFSVQSARILEEAAREFRRNEPRLEETVTGFVIALDRPLTEFDGKATLQVMLDNRSRRIHVQFTHDEYGAVIRAFQDKLLISVDGDIYSVGHRLELRNPRHLVLLTEVDED